MKANSLMSKYRSGILILVAGLFCYTFLFVAVQAKEADCFENNIQRDINHIMISGARHKVSNMTILPKDYQLYTTRYSLGGTGSISGYVREYAEDESGNPIEGKPLEDIYVCLFESDDPYWAGRGAWNWVTNVRTDDQGHYTFLGLTERQYHLSISQEQDSEGVHYIEADMYNIQVFDGAETSGIDFTLRRAGLIFGYIKNTEGYPISDARVTAICPYTEDGDDWHSTTEITAEVGRYKLWVLPSPGKFYYSISVEDANITDTHTLYETKIAPGLYQATLEGVHGPDFILNESGRISGRVVNEDGAGIEGVEVDPMVGRIDEPDDLTDANGYYVLENVPVTDRAYVCLDLSGLAIQHNEVKYARGDKCVGPFTITAGDMVTAPDMTLLVAGTLKGQVTDEDGVPIAGVEVEASGYDTDGYESDQDEVYTDAFGQYTIDYLAPGIYNVMAYKNGWMMGKKAGIVIRSSDITDCDLIMKNPNQTATVSGKITNYDVIKPKDPDGIALPYYNESYLEDYGIPVAQIFALSSNKYFTDQDYIEMVIGDAFFEGMVYPDDGYDDYFKTSTTEIPGSYTFNLPPGNVDIVIGYQASSECSFYITFSDWKRLILTAGSALTDQDLTADTIFGALKGDISVPTGFTPQKTLIAAFDKNDIHPGYPKALAISGIEYSYSIEHIPVGTYTLRAISDGLKTQVYENIVINQDANTNQDITFTSGGTLSGMVTDPNINPIEGALVKIEENGKASITSSSGSYTITGLAAGEFTVIVTVTGYANLIQTVTIIDSETTMKDFTLYSTVGSIAGTVTTNGKNINGATVVAYNTTSDPPAHKIDITVGGAFNITELNPGEYLLGVKADGYEVKVYPDTNTISLGENEDITGQNIILAASPPKFTFGSTVSDDIPPVLSMFFISDVDLDGDPNFSIITGNGALSDFNKVSDSQFTINYTADSNDTLVEIKIEGTGNGLSGNQIFSFEVSDDLVYTGSTNIYNAIGGKLTMMGIQDNTKVSVPPFALAGTGDDTRAIALTIERYGAPGDNFAGSVSAVYDFHFEDGNVSIAENHKVTVTMSYKLPADMSQEEFENTFEIRYFNVNNQKWQTDGIYNTKINSNFTITFDVDHLSKFAAFIKTINEMKFPIGWSMISLNVEPEDPTSSTLFPEATVIYGYQKGIGYNRIEGNEALEYGKGYWILLPEAKTYSFPGQPFDKYTMPAEDGWSMIGGCSFTAKATLNIGEIHVIYGYEQGLGYQRVSDYSNIEPGEGYWILYKDTNEQSELKVAVQY